MPKKQELAIETEQTKQQLRERSELWTGAFWWWILFWPVLVYKSKQGAKLDSEIRDLRERIQRLERESWELERR